MKINRLVLLLAIAAAAGCTKESPRYVIVPGSQLRSDNHISIKLDTKTGDSWLLTGADGGVPPFWLRINSN